MNVGGLVAVGDSIINGHGDSMAGVPALGWAQWLADAMDLSYTRYGKGGATSSYIVEELLPRVRGRYTVGAFNMGTNDALGVWDASVFRANVEKAATTLTAACDRVVVLTVPASEAATLVIREVADQYGVLVIDARLSGPKLLTADGVHPTALGHLEIADRVASELGVPRPSLLAVQEGRGRVGFGYLARYGERRIFSIAKNTVKRFTGPR